MQAPEPNVFASLIRKLERLADLTHADRMAIDALPYLTRSVEPRACLVREGRAGTKFTLLTEGYACRQKTTGDGKRQILSFHIPGDILDLQHMYLDWADCNVESITSACIVSVAVSNIKELVRQHPNIAEALWRDGLIDASMLREQVLNVGRRRGLQRVAHMLCEFITRRRAADPLAPDAFELPMTQEQIGDAVGLTSVHVNRMLRTLRDDGVIVQEGRSVRVADWPRLIKIGDFYAHYLHRAA